VIILKPGGLLSGQLDIDIFNTQGDLVFSDTQDKSEKVSIDISVLHKGLYILRVCNTENCIYKKLIKN